MKKRGQLLGTPFIMIFALVVGAMILIGGLYYVYKLTTFAKEIDIAKQVNDFKTKVNTYYYLEEGNSKRVKISMPAEAKNICFYDSNPSSASGGWNLPAPSVLSKDYPLDFQSRIPYYQNFFQSFTARKMFVFPAEKFKESSFEIPHLNLQTQTNNPICIRNNKEVRIISMGDHVEVAPI